MSVKFSDDHFKSPFWTIGPPKKKVHTSRKLYSVNNIWLVIIIIQ